ncbi:Ociad protein isoform 1 [Operophtera brumata]|uniref:Ociad protein isoform 1 n=1 Tax=Operophtera brumata TaxID=104452 RepID=A0A0L7K4F3_OPEBR|nr:Ociad protein isoform 1 [Operophtera brumata]
MSGKKDKKEEDCGCYAESRTQRACPPIQNVTHPLRYYEFTKDEIKALEECDKESFYQRCLPFSTLAATVTYAAMKYGECPTPALKYGECPTPGLKYGYLSRSPHFGVTPKVLMAACLGHVCGRLAYLPHCERKLRALPGHLGDVMRKHHAANNPPPAPNK